MDQLQLFQSEQQHPFCHYWRAMVRDCVRAIYKGRHDLDGHDWNWGSHGIMDYANLLLLSGNMREEEYQRLARLEHRCRIREVVFDLRAVACPATAVTPPREEEGNTNLESVSNSLS